MSDKSLKTALLDSLNEELTPYAFVPRKSEDEFFQKCEVGENRFELTFLTKYSLRVTCGTAIRCSVVQDFLCDTLKTAPDIKRYHTFHTMMEDHPDFARNYKFRLSSVDELLKVDEIPVIKEAFLQYFQQVSLPFYKRYDSLEKIYKLYTEYSAPEDKWVRQSPDWSSDAIILAKALNKKEYPELVIKLP